MAGVDPWRHTWRTLHWMADERIESDWLHTSMLCSVIANTVRDPKKRPKPFAPADFNPLELSRRKAAGIDRVSIADLKHLFVGD